MRQEFSLHIKADLMPLFAKVSDRFFLCASRYMPTFTDFYDPAKWSTFGDVLQRQGYEQGVEVYTFGGAEDCERRMLGFFPMEEGKKGQKNISKKTQFPIVRLRISHNSKFNKVPRHQDYLGSILGMGFDRGRIGDIFISSEAGCGEVFVYNDIADYICSQLEKVGKVPVKVQKVDKEEERLTNVNEEKEEQLNVASLRLDVVAAALFRLSRGQMTAMIKAEKVFLNWSPCVDGSKQVKPGDMVTLRGYGRARIGDIAGTTKKDRLRLMAFRKNNR